MDTSNETTPVPVNRAASLPTAHHARISLVAVPVTWDIKTKTPKVPTREAVSHHLRLPVRHLQQMYLHLLRLVQRSIYLNHQLCLQAHLHRRARL